MSVRFRICLAIWTATIAFSIACGTIQADVFETGKGWVIEIASSVNTSNRKKVAGSIPLTAPSTDIIDNTPAIPEPPTSLTPAATRPTDDDYRLIYRSIPFNRTEYNVNPSYRHDAAMEILTGHARHQTVLQHSTAPAHRPSLQHRVLPYRYNNLQHGLNYYFYFPYWNYRGIF